MNNFTHQEMVQEAVKKKFSNKKHLISKATPLYPASAEREYQRITNGYVRLLNKVLKKHLPKMMATYKKERRRDSRFDEINDLNDEVNLEFQKVAEELEQKIADYGLDKFIDKIGKMAQKRSLTEWKRVVQNTLGINLLDDYYKGDFYAKVLREWSDKNVLMIKSIPAEALGNMREIILNGYKKGTSITDLTKAIQNEYSVTKHKAAMLARDQLSTLNSQITQMQQKDAGVTKYRWSTSRDARVRECHADLEGQIFSWDEPPEMWYRTKSHGIVHTGRRCNPGEDYCCRCVAIPVFDYDALDVPMKE